MERNRSSGSDSRIATNSNTSSQRWPLQKSYINLRLLGDNRDTTLAVAKALGQDHPLIGYPDNIAVGSRHRCIDVIVMRVAGLHNPWVGAADHLIIRVPSETRVRNGAHSP